MKDALVLNQCGFVDLHVNEMMEIDGGFIRQLAYTIGYAIGFVVGVVWDAMVDGWNTTNQLRWEVETAR